MKKSGRGSEHEDEDHFDHMVNAAWIGMEHRRAESEVGSMLSTSRVPLSVSCATCGACEAVGANLLLLRSVAPLVSRWCPAGVPLVSPPFFLHENSGGFRQ